MPGGATVPTAGVTRVGVLPTHTRRGLLRSMLERLLTEAHGRGQVLASLRASESTIYGRFGFGLAGDSAAVRITTARALPLRVSDDSGRAVRIVPPGELLDTVPAVYERAARWRSGAVTRPDWMWQRILRPAMTKATTDDFGEKGVFVGVERDEHGVDQGYVLYEVAWDGPFGENAVGRGRIIDLFAADPASEIALWRYLLTIDLVDTWTSEQRPVGEPIRNSDVC